MSGKLRELQPSGDWAILVNGHRKYDGSEAFIKSFKILFDNK
jgi:hypothetical protein